MRFTEILTKMIIEESRTKFLYDKMVKPQVEVTPGRKKPEGLMDFETLKALILADPTSKVSEGMDIDTITEKNMDDLKSGKYTEWIVKNYVVPKKSDIGLSDDTDPKSSSYIRANEEYKRLFIEDLYKLTDDLRKFDRGKQYLPQDKRDINKFTPKSLFSTLRDLVIPEKKKKDAEQKEIKKTREGFKHGGAEIIHQGPKWTVIKISDKGEKGRDAAIYYGGFHMSDQGESRWCTSSPGLTYFNNYIKEGPLYVIFPNDDGGKVGKKTGLPFERYQFHFPSNQFMDRDDHQINLVQYLTNQMSELKDLFKQEFINSFVTKDPNKDNTKVEISYPNDSSSKYIAVYGIDDLFKNLPENLQFFNFNNNSKEDISIDIPADIGRFKSLKQLMLKNVVKTLPETITQLTELTFLSLPDNKHLKMLPKDLNKLKNLEFIHIGNTGIKDIPDFIKDNFETMSVEKGVYFKKE